MQFRPLHDHVLVKRLEAAEEKSVGSLFLIQPKKNRRKAMSWRLALENSRTMAHGVPLGWLWE